MEKKVCSKCKEEKELCEFQKRKDSNDGLRSECKSCIKFYHKVWRTQNPNKYPVYNKQFKINNPEIHKLMVLHFPYVEGEPYIDGTNITKELLIEAIENKIGVEEIEKMKESLIYQYHEKLHIVTKKKITLDL